MKDCKELIDESDEERYCPVCYEPFKTIISIEDGHAFFEYADRIQLPKCRHSYCISCLAMHVQNSIRNKNLPIPCPSVGNLKSCGIPIQEETVRKVLLSSESSSNGRQLLDKFQRFCRLVDDPSLVPCPRCDKLVPTGENLKPHAVTCDFCHHMFCSIHGDAHSGKSCSDYTKTLQKERLARKSELALKKFTKPCSHCGAYIQKESGCDHVICPACNKDMCYRCSTHIHLSGEATRTCSQCKQQYLDYRYTNQYRLRLCLMTPFFLVYVVLSSLGAILSGFFFCCFCCGRCIDGDYERSVDDDNNIRRNSSSCEDGGGSWSPYRAIRLGFTMVFLPFCEIMRELDLQPCRGLDDLALLEGRVSTEIPRLSTIADHATSRTNAPSTAASIVSEDDQQNVHDPV